MHIKNEDYMVASDEVPGKEIGIYSYITTAYSPINTVINNPVTLDKRDDTITSNG